MPPKTLLPSLAMLVAVVLWGGSFTATKVALADAPPIAFALARFTLATAILVLIQLGTRTSFRVPRSAWPVVCWAAFLGTTATYVLENNGLARTTSGAAALIIGLTPLLTVFGAALFLREKLSARVIVGALVATAGVCALVGGGPVGTLGGNMLMFATLVVNVAMNLVSARLARLVEPLTALTLSFGIGTLGLVPCALVEHVWLGGTWRATAPMLEALLFLVLGASVGAYWLWMYALKHMPASRVTVFIYLCPLVTLITGHQTLGEHLGWDTLAEAAAILAGVALATSARLAPVGEA